VDKFAGLIGELMEGGSGLRRRVDKTKNMI
jgi:hypothetical protein